MFGICFLLILTISFVLIYPIYQSSSELFLEKQNLQSELDDLEEELTNLNSQIYITRNELTNARYSLNKTISDLELRKLDGIYESILKKTIIIFQDIENVLNILSFAQLLSYDPQSLV